MRKTITILCVSTAVLIAIGSTVWGLSESKPWFQNKEVTDTYRFPITPENAPKEWKNLETHDDMVNACQIPDEILNSISTRGLIETCLDYPLFGDMFAYNSYLQGLEAVTGKFNGFFELENRPDAAKELLNYYKNIDYGMIVTSKDPYYTMRIRFFDYYMSQDKVILNLSANEREELLEACKNAIKTKSKNIPDIFSNDSTLYLAARIMQTDDEAFKDLIFKNTVFAYEFTQGRLSNELSTLVADKLDI